MLGVTMAYNEADCIAHAVRCLARAGHSIVLFDHGSTDGTQERALEAAKEFGVPLGVIRVDRKRVPFLRLFPYISKWIRSRSRRFDWVTWLAADEILHPPEDCEMERRHIEREWAQGIRVIRPFLREFWMTEKDPTIQQEADHVARLRYFRPRGIPGPNGRIDCPRAWKLNLTGVMRRGLHRRPGEWPKGTPISREKWWLNHYPVRTLEQAKRKIMEERPADTNHYIEHRATACRNLVRHSTDLECTDK